MDVVNRNEVVAFVTKDTSTIREILSPRNTDISRQSLAEATLMAGTMTQAHSHPHTEELYYILSGEGMMAVDGDCRPVQAGDGISIPPGRRHQIRNTGFASLVFLCCCVPAYSDTDTILCEDLIVPGKTGER